MHWEEVMSAEKTREFLYAEKACAIHREKDAETVRKKAYATYDGGLRVQEITWTTPQVAELIAEFTRKKLGSIGAGAAHTRGAEARRGGGSARWGGGGGGGRRRGAVWDGRPGAATRGAAAGRKGAAPAP